MSSHHQQVSEWLGLRLVNTEQDLINVAENKLPVSAISRLLSLGLTRAEIDRLVIPSRTLQHRRSRREKLTIDESDRVLKVMCVLSQAEKLYGSRERALTWLRRPNSRLNDRAPLSLLETAM